MGRKEVLEQIGRLRNVARNSRVPAAARARVMAQLDMAEQTLPKAAKSPRDLTTSTFWTRAARRNLHLHLGEDLRKFDPFHPSNLPAWAKRIPSATSHAQPKAPPAPPARPAPTGEVAPPVVPPKWEPTPEIDAQISAAMLKSEVDLIAQGVPAVEARVRAVDAGRDAAIKLGMPRNEAIESAVNLKRALAPIETLPGTGKDWGADVQAAIDRDREVAKRMQAAGLDPEVQRGVQELLAMELGPVAASASPGWTAVTDKAVLGRADATRLVSRTATAHGERYLLVTKVRPPDSRYGRTGLDGKPLWEANVRIPVKKGEPAKFRDDMGRVHVSQTSLYGYATTEAEARHLAEDLLNSLLLGTPQMARSGVKWVAIKGGWMMRTPSGYGVIRYGPKGTHYRVNLVHESGEVELLAEGAVPGRAREIAQDIVQTLIPR